MVHANWFAMLYFVQPIFFLLFLILFIMIMDGWFLSIFVRFFTVIMVGLFWKPV